MPDILHLVRIKAAPERVFEALTTAGGIRNWWTRQAELEPRVGGTGEFRFYEGKGVTRIRVDALEPARHVAWTTTSSNAPGRWDGTRITFDLKTEDDETVFSFAHRGFAAESEGYALVSTGWAYYLVSLQQYLERGRGAPQQDKNFAMVIDGPAVAGPEICHEVKIKARPSAVYRALTDVKQLGAWWIPDTRGDSQPGGRLEFRFAPNASQGMDVVALVPNESVLWRPAEPGIGDWAGTEIEFRIVPKGDVTHLDFRHSGWRGKIEGFPYYSWSWAVFLTSLKQLLETGKGFPFPNDWIP